MQTSNCKFYLLICFSLWGLISCQSSPPSGSTVQASFQAPESNDKVGAENAKTQFVEANGIQYAYRQFGKKGTIPLLMMTRFRATMDDWDPAFLNELAKDRTLIVFNNAGVASSSGEVPTTIKGAADHGAILARALGYSEIDVLGWSMAGFTAQVIAIEYPDLIRKVILIGTGPGGSAETPPPSREGVFEVATRAAYSPAEHEYLFFSETSEGEQAMQASLKRIQASRNGQLETPTTPAVMERQATAITAFWFEGQGDYFSKLKNIKQPVLIVNGDRDAFFSVEAQWLLYREIPNACLAIYPVAGHGPHHQFPVAIGQQVNYFLSGPG